MNIILMLNLVDVPGRRKVISDGIVALNPPEVLGPHEKVLSTRSSPLFGSSRAASKHVPQSPRLCTRGSCDDATTRSWGKTPRNLDGRRRRKDALSRYLAELANYLGQTFPRRRVHPVGRQSSFPPTHLEVTAVSMPTLKANTQAAAIAALPLRYGIVEAAQILRMSRAQLYSRISDGAIKP